MEREPQTQPQPSPAPDLTATGDEGKPRREAATESIGRRAGALSDELDFPEFVASLVHGTFDAIVNSSIRQMETFADLVAAVAKPVDQFAQENGKSILSVQPGVLGSLTFYSAAFVGLIAVILLIRKYRRPAASAQGASEMDQAVLDRYHGQIEKEVEKLD